MNKEKPYFLKRFAAYLIDMIIVSLLATAISLVFLDNSKYQGETEALMTLTKKYTNNEVTKEEYTKQFDELNYVMTKDNVGVTVVNIGVGLVYYVVLCYFCHGITLGKYLLKMKIVSSKDKELNLGNYLLRALFVNLILSNIVSVVLVTTLDKGSFVSIYPKISNVLTLFVLATIIFMMYRSDGKGLHDMISGTVVVSTKVKKLNVEVEEKNDDVKEEVTEAKVIEEKHTKNDNVKKKDDSKKKTTKKSTKKTGGKK